MSVTEFFNLFPWQASNSQARRPHCCNNCDTAAAGLHLGLSGPSLGLNTAGSCKDQHKLIFSPPVSPNSMHSNEKAAKLTQ